MEIKWIKDIQYFEELPSTQDCALDLARQGAEEGILIIAERQTQARGRKTRDWFSPQGGLWFSLILRPKIAPFNATKLNLCIGLAVVEAVKEIAGISAVLKWPNDIYFKEKKLGGILIDTETGTDFLKFAVAGVGLNTNVKLDDFPQELRQLATSIMSETDRPVDNLAIVEKILENYKMEQKRILNM